MLKNIPFVRPPLDPGFLPAALWNRAYRSLVSADPGARSLVFALERPDGWASRFETRVLGADHPSASHSLRYAERLLKFLLWQKGGCTVRVAGAPEIAAYLAEVYSPAGARAFDHAFMGEKIYGRQFSIRSAAAADDLPPEHDIGLPIGRHLDGCRIGFDLGGSDRKAAAVIDGRVVFSEETPWDPYFQRDPAYHIEGIHESLCRAAAHLPRVDAIGGSAAGVYVNNEVRVASLFRGISPEVFEHDIRRLFFTLQERWGNVPFVVANDGEVAALAGSMSLGDNAVLGISMGTSQAAGYVRPRGDITPWLNELAFAPVDYSPDAPADEWSGDAGCGVQYFSQQAASRLAARSGFVFPEGMPAQERLAAVQAAMAGDDPRAGRVYDSIGAYLGYSIGHYAEFYDLRHVLVTGRVTSGAGGERIILRARDVLSKEFPEVASRVRVLVPDEKDKRHGQAVAAASLPAVAGAAGSRRARNDSR
ncbi:MAG TPA: ROK family protein [Opitutaceae bacterium]|nr:ROK family protein [Opitutaceae bacterium]